MGAVPSKPVLVPDPEKKKAGNPFPEKREILVDKNKETKKEPVSTWSKNDMFEFSFLVID
tara:strand:+ start:9574 stop:9753 length:180 start_codon:yes stop_codon:yes gene_type:complete